jgi:N-acetylglucosaminyl-diphospho-decaprenol L-rhamnosyltransferase
VIEVNEAVEDRRPRLSDPGQAGRLSDSGQAGRLSSIAVPDLSIAVVTWNSARWIERCLRSIPPACKGLAYEVVVYDNGSFDDTLDRVEQWGAGAPTGEGPAPHLVYSSNNDGFAAATNRAFTQSRGRYFFMLNPDCELAPLALTRLVEFMESDPAAAAAAPLLEDEAGESQREFQLRRLPTFRSLLSEIFAFAKLLPRNRATAHYRYRDLELTSPQRIEQPAAAALLIRREVFDEVGPLDERFMPAWFEDVDYCRRLANAGKAMYVVPSAVARHYGGASLEHLSFSRFNELWYRNMWLYARKWFGEGEAETLRWAIMLGLILRSFAALIGIAHPEVGKWRAIRAYLHAMGRTFHRWAVSSRSS